MGPIDKAIADIADEADELDNEHVRDEQVDGCRMCWPKDGHWPCTSALIATELRSAVARAREALTDA